MKPTKNFKMPGVFKCLLASIVNKADRDTYRQCVIQAVLQSEIKPEKEKSKKHMA